MSLSDIINIAIKGLIKEAVNTTLNSNNLTGTGNPQRDFKRILEGTTQDFSNSSDSLLIPRDFVSILVNTLEAGSENLSKMYNQEIDLITYQTSAFRDFFCTLSPYNYILRQDISSLEKLLSNSFIFIEPNKIIHTYNFVSAEEDVISQKIMVLNISPFNGELTRLPNIIQNLSSNSHLREAYINLLQVRDFIGETTVSDGISLIEQIMNLQKVSGGTNSAYQGLIDQTRSIISSCDAGQLILDNSLSHIISILS